MFLNKDEAICLVLGFSKNNEISSFTKLNKLLARLNLHYIPIDINFNLSKYGSFSAELKGLKSTDYYIAETYQYGDAWPTRLILTDKGRLLFDDVVRRKLSEVLTWDDLGEVKQEIFELSGYKAAEISENEHKILLVDTEDRFKLIQKANQLSVELLDLYEQLISVPSDSFANITFKALVEYCYYLARYLKQHFYRLDETYDYEANMFDYYFLYHLEKIVPFLKKQFSETTKDNISTNKYYSFLINSVRENYPFSLNNQYLKDILT